MKMSEKSFVDSELKSRASPEQLAALLEFMESHGDLARPQDGMLARLKTDRLWQELGNLLDAMDGAISNPVEKWKKVWADWKVKTKKKALIKQREVCGGGPHSRSPITTFEKRVLGIMGLNAVVGNSMIEEAGFDEPLNNPMQPPTQSSVGKTVLYTDDNFSSIDSIQLFVDLENRRLQLEKEREKNLHQREMAHLRLESRRLYLEEQQVQFLHRVESILEAILMQISNRP